MKKLFSLCLVLSLLCCLCGCHSSYVPNDNLSNSTTTTTSVEDEIVSVDGVLLSLGYYEEPYYRNDCFGIRYYLGGGWICATNEEILQQNGLTKDMTHAQQMSILGKAPIIYDFYATSEINGSTINVNMEKLTDDQAANLNLKQTLESQFDGIKDGLTNLGYSDVTVRYDTVHVCEKDYDAAIVHATIQGTDFYKVVFCFQRGNYVVNITVTSLQVDFTKDMLSLFVIA